MKRNLFAHGLKRIVALAAMLVLMMTCVSVEAVSSVKIPLTITASDLTYPSTMYSGDSFSLRGEVKASYGNITMIRGWIVNRANGKTVMDKAVYPNKKSVGLRNTLNTKLKFGSLAAGKYTLKISVVAKSGSKKTTKTIMSKNFTVYAKRPGISVSGGVYPQKIKQGNKAPIRGLVRASSGVLTEVRAAVYNEDGVALMTAKYTPNKKTFDLRYSLNVDFTFAALPKGKYTFQLVAKAKDGNATKTVTLVNQALVVN